MRIGVVTFHRAHNCGAVLQCLALVKVLQRMGHEVKVIDCNKIGEGSLIPNVSSVRVWLGWFKSLVIRQAMPQRLWLRYWRFMKRSFPLSDWIDKGVMFPNDFDKIILGSDQVLNPGLTGSFLETFLLRNRCPDEKKIAYAASFGVSTLEESWRGVFADCLSRFRALGLREESGVRICREELRISVSTTVTIDPTLLLDAEDYRKFESPVLRTGEYVLVYWIGNSTEYVSSLAHRIAKNLGINVIVASITARKDDASWRPSSPDEFLYLFRNARCVVTTSFHGTSFSIINRKPFITVIPKGMNVAGRMIGLLEQLSLSSQLISEGDVVTDEYLLSRLNIDFGKAEASLDRIRKESIRFLENALG